MASAAEASPAELVLGDRSLRSRLAILRRGFGSQLDVVNALILRETRTRFGRNRLGYLWAVVEPVVVTLTFYVVIKIAGRELPPGMGTFGFIATGVLPYTLFSNSVTRVGDAISGNKPLLYYPQVRPLDLVISRSLLEAATFVAVFILVMGADALATRRLEVHDPLLVIGGMAAASALGTSLGLVFCGLSQFSPLADRARGPLMRPLFWVSGIFFTAGMVPESTRDAFLWNPVLHATEMTRAGWFVTHDARHVDPGYVLWWIGGMALVGLLLERLVRRRMDLT
jgi:capsular polysaccharide transport system permease protein